MPGRRRRKKRRFEDTDIEENNPVPRKKRKKNRHRNNNGFINNVLGMTSSALDLNYTEGIDELNNTLAYIKRMKKLFQPFDLIKAIATVTTIVSF